MCDMSGYYAVWSLQPPQFAKWLQLVQLLSHPPFVHHPWQCDVLQQLNVLKYPVSCVFAQILLAMKLVDTKLSLIGPKLYAGGPTR